jgi:hypothetical protein
MSLSRFLKSAGVGVLVAVLVLVLGVAGQVAWVVLGLLSRGDAGSNAVRIDFAVPWFSFASGIFAIVGLLVGFSWAHRRHRARTLRGQSGEAS